MKTRALQLIAPALGLAILTAGCGSKSTKVASHDAPPVQEPTVAVPAAANSMANWKWEIPAPPVPDMVWVPAGHFRKAERTPQTVDAIVIHTTEGRFDDAQSFEANQNRAFTGNINYFKHNDRNVSAHYVMGPNGEICNMVNETDVAHTQTYYNGRAFGIECAGWGRYPEQWTPELMDSLVDLCAYLCVKWEIPAYQPEGTAYEGPWSVTLDEDTKRFVGVGLVGHYQVQPWNKSDPGPHFPWEEFTERVREKIREYGVEPIPLPEAAAEVAKISYVSAKIKEPAVAPGQPFTYRLVIHGTGAEQIKPEDIIFPDLTVVPHVRKRGEATRVESAQNHVVYELPLIANEQKGIAFTASRVQLNGQWLDSGTVNVRIPSPDGQQQRGGPPASQPATQ